MKRFHAEERRLRGERKRRQALVVGAENDALYEAAHELGDWIERVHQLDPSTPSTLRQAALS
jgi:hypothetical protein